MITLNKTSVTITNQSDQEEEITPELRKILDEIQVMSKHPKWIEHINSKKENIPKLGKRVGVHRKKSGR